MNLIRRLLPACLLWYALKPDAEAKAPPPSYIELYGPYVSKNEGYRDKPYRDTLGNWTVGFGHKMTHHDLGWGRQDRYTLRTLTDQFHVDLLHAIDAARGIDCMDFDRLPLPARQVLVDLAFQLGGAGLKQFSKFLGHLRAGSYGMAGVELLHSKYGQQCPARAWRNYSKLVDIDVKKDES